MIVYKIINNINNKFYVGSTKNFIHRKGQHLSALRKGKHHSVVLQRAWAKYGESNFSFIVHSRHSTVDEMLCEEQKLLRDADYNSCSSVYKVSDNGIPVNQFTIDGIFIREWDSALAASRELRLNAGDITQCCKGRKYRVGSFYFAYKNNPIPRKKSITKADIAKRNKSNRVRKYLVTFPDGSEKIVVGLKKFCEENGLYYPSAHQVVLGTRGRKTHKGYKFKKYEEA